MTKEANQVEGVKTTRRVPVVVVKETNPDRGQMSYEDALKDNARIREEREASENAIKAVRAKHGKTAPVVDAGDLNVDAVLDEKRKALAQAEIALKSDPKSTSLKKTINKLNKEIDELEDQQGEE